MSLGGIVASLGSSYDLVVAEGFNSSAVPKVLVLRRVRTLPRPQGLIAVVSDQPAVGGVPCYGFDDLDRLAEQIQDLVLARDASAPSVSLDVDGVPIPLGPFPSSALAGMIQGFLTSLKDVPTTHERVHLVLDASSTPVKRKDTKR